MGKKIHVMQVLHTLEIGGAEKLAYDIAKNFDQGFTFSFFCLDALGPLAERIKDEGGAVYCYGRKDGWDFSLIKKYAQLVTDTRVDILHAHQYTPYFYSALASLWSKYKPRVIFTEHGRHQPDKVRWKRVFFNTLLRPWTHLYTGVAQFSKDSLVEFEKIPASKIQVIYNGVKLDRFPKLYEKCAVRKKLKLPQTDKIIGIVARLDPIKDHITLIKAFALLRNDIPNTKLLIIGDGPMRSTLEQFVRECNTTANVEFWGMRDDVPDILMALDVFVLPSIMEATSVTLLEAMSASLPVIASNVGGNKEIIAHEKNGILFPVSDSGALAEHIKHVLFDEIYSNKLGQNARRNIEENLTFEKMIENYKTAFLSVMRK